MKTAIAFSVAVAISLIGCGKKAPQSKYTLSDFEHPSPQLLQDIARTQDWKLADVEARNRAFDALESGRQPTEADWQQLVKAADCESNGFDISLAMQFSRHMSDKYRGPVLKWCERNMEQTADPYAAVIGYDCYVRSGGGNRDLWAGRLKARGQFYIDQIAEIDKRVAAKK